MGIGSYTYVSIDGVDVSSHVINWRVPETLSDTIDRLELFMKKSVENVITLNNELEVIVKRGKTNVVADMDFYFRGSLISFAPKGATLEIIGQNKLRQWKRREVSKNYDINEDAEAGVLSAIMQDLGSTFGGLTTSVVSSSTLSRPITVYPCNKDKVWERIERLREVLNWVTRYDYSADQAVIEPKGNTVNSQILRYNTAGTTNILNIPKWESSSDDMVNSVTIMGRADQQIKTENFTGDGTTTTFTLVSTPFQTQITVDGAEQTLGAEGSGGTYHYYVKQHLKQIVFVTAPGNTLAIVVKYGLFKPPVANRVDQESIDLYCPDDPNNPGEKLAFEDTFVFQDVFTQDDAEQRAEEVLARFSRPLLSTLLMIPHLDDPIRAGESIQVVDDVNLISDFFIVTEIVHQWPEPTDMLHVGQERVFERNTLLATEERLQKLERREYQNVENITYVRDLIPGIRAFPYLIVYTRDTTPDGAWGKGFGNGTNSGTLAWGAAGALWQSSYTNSLAVHAVTWPDLQYEEDFTETFFVDSSNTTATVDTTNNQVTF